MIDHEIRLPDWNAEYRREIEMLATARATRKQLGPHFDHVTYRADGAGNPSALIFVYTGNNRMGTERTVGAFMRDILVEVANRHGIKWPPAPSELDGYEPPDPLWRSRRD